MAFPRGVQALGTAAGPTGLAAAFTAFDEKARVHCRREEAFMPAIGYTRRAEHEEQHAIPMAKFDAMVNECRAWGIQVFDDIGQEWVRD